MTLLQQHQPARQLADEPPSTMLHGIDAKTEWLFSKFLDPSCPQSQRQQAREQIVGLYLPWASSLARRFGSRGEPLDDLVQVASYALVKAVDRFDPARGVPFTAYATPTMLGELKRHFRDHGWDVRVPRRFQEGHLALSKARSELAQQLQRDPTPAELARRLQVDEQDLRDFVKAGAAYVGDSLNRPISDEEPSDERQDLIGECDPDVERACDRIALQDALRQLPQRERDIVIWYFYGNQTQQQIAERIGISQMHVSRLLAKAVARLRRSLVGQDEPPPSPKQDVRVATRRSGPAAADIESSGARVPSPGTVVLHRPRTTGLPPRRPTPVHHVPTTRKELWPGIHLVRTYASRAYRPSWCLRREKNAAAAFRLRPRRRPAPSCRSPPSVSRTRIRVAALSWLNSSGVRTPPPSASSTVR